MYGFIPSWYGKDRDWVRDADSWHSSGDQMEFDDTVNQIKIFQMAGEDVEILLLSCIPDLRHFLHREGIHSIQVWSVFDEIQNVKGSSARQIYLNDYAWPKDIEWFYNPFLMLGYREGSLYARAEFSDDGRWLEATLYEQGAPSRQIHLDDRGFISYTVFYQDSEPKWRIFYDRRGRWQVKEDLSKHRVYVNPQVSGRFNKTIYENFDSLIEEILRKHLAESEGNNLIIALDNKHDEMIRKAAGSRNLAYSVFSQRNGIPARSLLSRKIKEDRLLVADTQYLANEIRSMFPGYEENVLDISPYDTRLAIGKSTHIKALKILFYCSSEHLEGYSEALKDIFEYMKENKRVFLTVGIGSKVPKTIFESLIEAEVQHLMDFNGFTYKLQKPDKNIAENETEEEAEPRIAVKQCRSETQVIEALSDHRIVVDLGNKPDLYLQIAGISAGLPIVLGTESQYVSHKNNGWILQNDYELKEALRFYLDGLANWNRSLIWSLRRINEYTNGIIVDRWKKAMEKQDSRSGKENGRNSDW